ncbi:hypothetical protein MJH12_08750 [bacterium]|nr:hypothetical protein [bacterium]
MKNYTLLLCNLFILHQFFYLPNIHDSFYTAKWVLFSSVFFGVFSYYLYDSKSAKDLKLDYRSRVVFLLFLSIFLISDLLHQSHYFFNTLGLCSFTYCMIYFYRRTKFDLNLISGPILILLSFFCFLELSGLAPFQGELYHLSVFTGNPNLFAASFVFWFYIHRKKIPTKYLLAIILFTIVLLVLSKSRSALLTFLIIESFLFIRKTGISTTSFSFPKLGISLLLLSVVSYCLVKNPFEIEGFSRLEIRMIESKISLNILKKNYLLGIGQGNYRSHYFQELGQSEKDYHSYEDQKLLRHLRMSSYSHFTPLSLFVSLGLPLATLWIFLWIYLMRILYKNLDRDEFLALISLLIMSITYYIFHFSLIVLPALTLLAKSMSKNLKVQKSCSSYRFLPLIPLFAWCAFWVSALEFELFSLKDKEAYLKSSYNHGRLNHELIREILESRSLPKEEDFFQLLDIAQKKMPDPITFYHGSKYYYLKGEKKKAMAYLQLGINILPSYASFYYARALMQEDPMKAYLDYLLVVKMDRKFVPAWKNMAILQLETSYIKAGIYSISSALKFYLEKNGSNHLPSDSYYQELLEIERVLKGKLGAIAPSKP